MELKDPSLFKQACLVDGQWIEADDKSTVTVYNPADGSVVGTVPNLGATETKRAINAAARAFPAWKALLPMERSNILRRWQQLISENAEDLAKIITTEQGKPLAEARNEILSGINYLSWYAEEARRVYGEVLPSPWAGKQPLTIRQPIGVTAAITPWNFPLSMITRKTSPALAVGCPMVVKPASMTPFAALALGELAMRAGVPAGVLSVVTGSASAIGGEICSSSTVRKLSFTGSTAVGKKLLEACAGTVKKVSLELGGNAPLIVCKDADLDKAVDGVMASKFRNAGQTCVCANRIFVHTDVAEVFMGKLVKKVQGLVLGNGLASGVTQGPLIDGMAHKNMQALIQDAVSKGAKVETGGKPSAVGSQFFEPTVLSSVTPQMRVFREEIFGPIAPVMTFTTEEEVIALANDTEYGLASYVFTRDIGSYYRLSTNLEFGMVGINEVALSTGEAPFGGVKESGLGREGGKQGLDEYLETKYILLGGLS